MSVMVTFRWDEEFVRRVDAVRGLVPRSAFVKDVLERVLDEPAVLGATVEKEKKPSKPAPKVEALEKIKEQAGLTTAAEMTFRQMCPERTCDRRVPSASDTVRCQVHGRKMIAYDADAYAKREFS